jgi:calcineurin-like phosphoesterase family protein
VNFSEELDNTFVCADMHLGHANIVLYSNRPWLQPGDFIPADKPERDARGRLRRPRPKWVSKEIKEQRAHEMNAGLVSGWNEVIPPGATCYHIGDFCLSRWQNMGQREWEAKLNGNVVHITGNHDRSNGVRGLKCAMLEVHGHSMFLVHRPVYRVEEVPDFCDIVVCGHVHEAWDHKWVEDVLLINVGVDVTGFRPLSIRQVITKAKKLRREKKRSE